MGIISKFFDRTDSVAYFVLLSSAFKIIMACINRKRLVGHVSRLVLYPVKSMAGVTTDQLQCKITGSQHERFGDRHFIVMKGDKNVFVSARIEPTLLLVRPRMDGSFLHLTADKMDPITIDLHEVERLNRQRHGVMHEATVVGLDCGDHVASWLDDFLGKPNHRLLFLAPSVDKLSIRNATIKYAAWSSHIDASDKMGYQDFSPYHLLSLSSVDDLNSHLGDEENISADNFRPNIFVSGSSPYEEDSWERVFIGEAEFSSFKLCSRCILTTIDPKTAKKSNEPLIALRSYRKLVPSFEESPCFGINLGVVREGEIRVGDAVYALVGRPRLTPVGESRGQK